MQAEFTELVELLEGLGDWRPGERHNAHARARDWLQINHGPGLAALGDRLPAELVGYLSNMGQPEARRRALDSVVGVCVTYPFQVTYGPVFRYCLTYDREGHHFAQMAVSLALCSDGNCLDTVLEGLSVVGGPPLGPLAELLHELCADKQAMCRDDGWGEGQSPPARIMIPLMGAVTKADGFAAEFLSEDLAWFMTECANTDLRALAGDGIFG